MYVNSNIFVFAALDIDERGENTGKIMESPFLMMISFLDVHR